MLILAGITINLTIGQDGILKRAEEAGRNYTNAADYEREQIAGLTNEADKIINSLSGGTPTYPALGTVIRTENNIKYTADGAGNEIPVPVGFTAITSQDQGTLETGFVIKNDTDGNEFVWVPVEGMGYSYGRVVWTGNNITQVADGTDETTNSTKIKGSTESSYYFTESMPEDEKISVETYGGYYIGRYEAGVASTEERTSSSGTTDTILVQKGKTVYNYIKYSDAKAKTESLYTKANDNVTSRLCSSYAWDTALRFIKTQNSTYPTNSEGGNYSGVLSKTGYDTTHPCNIYDMGGNVTEWTTEVSGEASYADSLRGNSYLNGGGAAASRDSAWSGAYPADGFRVTLFL